MGEVVAFPTSEIDPPQDLFSFEEQFSERQTHVYRGTTFESFDVIPENVDTEQPPLVIAHGWSQGPDTLRGPVEAFYDRGHRVMGIVTPRGGRIPYDPSHPRHDVLLREANLMQTMLDDKEVGMFNLTGHSKGGIVATTLADLEPDRINALVLWNSAGLSGPENFPHLLGSLSVEIAQLGGRFVVEGRSRGKLLQSARETATYVARNPLMSLREGLAISQTQLIEDLVRLRNQGVPVGVLVSQADRIFHHARVSRQVTADVAMLRVFEHPRSTHHAWVLYPEKIVGALHEMFDELGERHEPFMHLRTSMQ